MVLESPEIVLVIAAVAALSLLKVIGIETARRARTVELRFKIAEHERKVEEALKAKQRPKEAPQEKAA